MVFLISEKQKATRENEPLVAFMAYIRISY